MKLFQKTIINGEDGLRIFKAKAEVKFLILRSLWIVFVVSLILIFKLDIIQQQMTNHFMVFIIVLILISLIKLIITYMLIEVEPSRLEINYDFNFNELRRRQNKGLKFLLTFHINQPVATLSIIGLLLAKKYYLIEYDNLIEVWNRFLPLYANAFSSMTYVILLILLSCYIYNIKSKYRNYIGIWLLINIPVIFTAYILGLLSILYYPVRDFFSNYSNYGSFVFLLNWVINPINMLVLMAIPIFLLSMIRALLDEHIESKINKFKELTL